MTRSAQTERTREQHLGDGTDLVSAVAPEAGRAATSEWTDVPALGVRVHARTWLDAPGPASPPVVLVHGLSLSSRYLVPLGRRLAALGHQVLAPDLPGFGRTRKPAGASWPAGPSVHEQADQLVAWLDARGIDKAVLFGNSVGVQVAVDLAVRFPERVDRLVLEGATPDPAYRTPLRQYSRVLRNMMFESPSLNSVFQLEYASAGIPRMVQQLRRTVVDQIEDKLPHVQAPALVVRGRYDQTLSQAWAEEFTQLLPHARLVVVEGAAHIAHYSAPQTLARVMELFLQGGLDALPEGEVVPEPGPQDPLTPAQPISTRAHAVLDYATAGLALALPRLLGWGPRTRRLLTLVGAGAASYSALTDYELGIARKIPLTVHLNLDSASGMQLLLAAATLLRRESRAERLAVAAFGAYEVYAANATRKPTGVARVLALPAREVQAGDRQARAAARTDA